MIVLNKNKELKCVCCNNIVLSILRNLGSLKLFRQSKLAFCPNSLWQAFIYQVKEKYLNQCLICCWKNVVH
ncbi:hypothetical protein BpHYR1_014698 [Brachionus plicatilis]|uniref:Uncharacterized protein n=1 Tax=Brachionus plicatilis TaxID=10195 RepID=A0A3M7RID1_BRAPC|nr:hypothetical protein BpHYR1_014698 [Brachionus plicatilis]